MIMLVTEEPRDLLERRWPNTERANSELYDYVASIIAHVRNQGDQAILEYSKSFDKVVLTGEDIRVTPQEIEEAFSHVSDEQVEALHMAKGRLEAVESERLKRLSFKTSMNGVTINQRVLPIGKVGCYVPGGRAAYPSTLIMNVTPAIVVGVPRVVVCTPPGKDGEITPLTLVAADICGVNTVYRVGGAQAVAALAYGTETIEPVEKIVGPGNKYVTAAKNLVSKVVSIDKPAGPTEILIVADESADPRLIVYDMISQAEHGEGGISGLVTFSKTLADCVMEALEERLKEAPRGDDVSATLSEGGFIYVCSKLDEAVSFVNKFAPEHLEIHTEEPMKVAEKIISAGLILLGPYTPVSATDYCMGVNHVLPTGGYGKINSGLSVLDYVKIVSVVQCSREGLDTVRNPIRALADAEGLPNHGLAVEGRFMK